MLLGWILDGRKTWSMCFTTVSVPQVGFCAHLLNQKALWDPLPLLAQRPVHWEKERIKTCLRGAGLHVAW